MPQAEAAATVSVPVSVRGLPPDLQIAIIVDGNPEGTIPGGGTRSFKLAKDKPHTFQVDSAVEGQCSSFEGTTICTRFKCLNSIWNLDVIRTQACQMVPVCYEVYVCDSWGCRWDYYCAYEQQCWTQTELSEKGYAFQYYAEHEVMIVDEHGQNVHNWYKDGSSLSFSAQESVVITDERDRKERDTFQDWVVDGIRTESRTLTLGVDRPYYIMAEYGTETQYRVRVLSEFGDPVMDSPNGWYMKGDEATISVQKQVPLDGWMGALGGNRVFVAWHGSDGVESTEPKYTFEVQEPMKLNAEWRTDDSQPITIVVLVVLVALAVSISAFYWRWRTRPISSPSSPRMVSSVSVQPSEYVPTQLPDAGMQVCFGCGSPVPSDSAACPRCGKPI